MKKKVLAMSVLAAISSQAGAFQFDTGDDWNIRWDNSFKANLMSRTHKAERFGGAPGRTAALKYRALAGRRGLLGQSQGRGHRQQPGRCAVGTGRDLETGLRFPHQRFRLVRPVLRKQR